MARAFQYWTQKVFYLRTFDFNAYFVSCMLTWQSRKSLQINEWYSKWSWFSRTHVVHSQVAIWTQTCWKEAKKSHMCWSSWWRVWSLLCWLSSSSLPLNYGEHILPGKKVRNPHFLDISLTSCVKLKVKLSLGTAPECSKCHMQTKGFTPNHLGFRIYIWRITLVNVEVTNIWLNNPKIKKRQQCVSDLQLQNQRLHSSASIIELNTTVNLL